MDAAALLIGIVLGVVLGCLLGALAATLRVRGQMSESLAASEKRCAGLEAEAQALRRLSLEGDELRSAALAQFRGVSGDALAMASSQFLTLAEQRLAAARQAADGDLAKREQAVAELVRPLGEALEQVRRHVTDLEKERAGQTAALSEQIRAVRETGEGLRRETASLVAALRKPQARGAWGELHLRRSVEAAGMVDRVDFLEQVTVDGGEGRQRPDMLVRLTGGKQVVVDAKVPLEAFLDAVQCDDEAIRAARLEAHARHVRSHVDALASKAYWKQFAPTPEFVVMFVPGESFLSAALDVDPKLLEHAFERKVVLASPSTLVAILRTVAYAWSQEAVAEDAQKVLDLGKQFVERLETLGSHLDRVGRALSTSVQAYNDAVGSYDRRVLVTARRFADLSVTDRPLEAPSQLDVVPRSLRSEALPGPSPSPGLEGTPV